ncbi:MAG: DUF192 domain-containing protein [Patescibacteria group bacterium]|jgi:uncharacterized membrane protein (UPF0127 family)
MLLIILFIAFLLIGGTSMYFAFSQKTGIISLNGTEYPVWIADNPVAQAQGLSGKVLDDFSRADVEGMIFLFDEVQERTFWMHEMKFDLDVLWMADGTIVAISKDVPAPVNGEEPVRMGSGLSGADMVLEVPAGWVAEKGAKIGDSLIFKN